MLDDMESNVDEQQRALRSLINFLVREGLTEPVRIKALVREKLRKKYRDEPAAEYTDDDYNNYVNKGHRSKAFNEIYKSIWELCEKRKDKIPEYIMPIVRYCFPTFAGFSPTDMASADAIFLNHAQRDVVTKRQIEQTYAGVFDLFRYSRHIDDKPDVKGDGKVLSDIDAWVVKSGMQVYPYKDGEHYARFKIYYQPSPKRHFGRIFEINGIVVPIRPMLYFIGFEKESGYPIIIMTTMSAAERIQHFMGMIVRYAERVLCSRIAFRRSTHNTLDEVKGHVGIFKESAISNEIEVFGESLLNEVEYKGKCALSVYS